MDQLTFVLFMFCFHSTEKHSGKSKLNEITHSGEKPSEVALTT